MASFIPTDYEERINWANNFRNNYPELALKYGFSQADIDKAIAACDSMIFAIKLARAAKLFSKVCTTFRNEFMRTDDRVARHIPQFVMPEAPAELSMPDVIRYLQRTARRVKAQQEYTPVDGAALGIIARSSNAVLREDAKPKGKAISLANSVVRINWVKGKFKGVVIESRRGGETKFTELSRDFSSPFIDTRPPLVAGQPETREYRLRYLVDDRPFAEYSYILTAVTTP